MHLSAPMSSDRDIGVFNYRLGCLAFRCSACLLSASAGRLFLLTLMLAAFVPCCATASAIDNIAPCRGHGTQVIVDILAGKLYLCLNGRAEANYSIATGRGGTGKTRQGDKKTPLGVYGLGSPRTSAKYYIFIPVGYPTSEQKASGYTGDNIGIHGPRKQFAWLGGVNNWFDWTLGCIAVGSRDDIRAIAHWVKKHDPVSVNIH